MGRFAFETPHSRLTNEEGRIRFRRFHLLENVDHLCGISPNCRLRLLIEALMELDANKIFD